MISEYELYPIQIMYLFFNLSIIIFVDAFLFLEKYVSKRLLTFGKLDFVYTIKYEISKCTITGLICAVLLYAMTLLFKSRKKIKYLKYNQKTKEQFIQQAEKLIKSYKMKNIISIILCFLFMIFILFYLTVFIQVYPKLYYKLLENFIISLVLCFLFQVVICMIVSFLRHTGKSWYIKFFYKLSSILI